MKVNAFLTCSWRFLIYNKSEQLEFKLEKLFGSRNMQEKLEKLYCFCFPELPDEGPVITGGLLNYQLNDQLTLNCTSPRTFPPTLLKWKINKKAVSFLVFSIDSFMMTCQII